MTCFLCDSDDLEINKNGHPMDATGDWFIKCNQCGAEWFTDQKETDNAA